MCLQDFPGSERAVPMDARSLRRRETVENRNNQQ